MLLIKSLFYKDRNGLSGRRPIRNRYLSR